jgi:hypothetical protein
MILAMKIAGAGQSKDSGALICRGLDFFLGAESFGVWEKKLINFYKT